MASVSDITLDVQVSITSSATRARVFPLLKTESNSAKITKIGENGTGKANGTDTGAYFTVPLTALTTKAADTGWIDVGYVYVNGGATSGTSLAAEASVDEQSITSVTFTDPNYTAN